MRLPATSPGGIWEFIAGRICLVASGCTHRASETVERHQGLPSVSRSGTCIIRIENTSVIIAYNMSRVSWIVPSPFGNQMSLSSGHPGQSEAIRPIFLASVWHFSKTLCAVQNFLPGISFGPAWSCWTQSQLHASYPSYVAFRLCCLQCPAQPDFYGFQAVCRFLPWLLLPASCSLCWLSALQRHLVRLWRHCSPDWQHFAPSGYPTFASSFSVGGEVHRSQRPWG